MPVNRQGGTAMSKRSGRIAGILAMAALSVGSADLAGASGAAEPDWKRALRIRSEAMNERYGLGDFAPSWRHALEVRGEALNREMR
jgi:hypothetical protein